MSDESPDILFSEEDHSYKVDGIMRPSVTTILKDLGFIDFSRVDPFVLDQAKARGKAVHAAVHFLEENDLDWKTVDERIKPYLEAFDKFKNDLGWIPTIRERIVFSPTFNYAGTLDAFGKMSRLGIEEALVDFKSGIRAKAAAFQTAAYSIALIKPHVRRASVHLKRDGRYQVVWHDDRSDIDGWKSIVACYHLREKCR